MTRRVAVTGIGVVAPGGIGVPAFWDLLSDGRTATRGITLFDPQGLRSRIAAECDFDPLAHGLDIDVVERADRYIQFALVAAQEAVTDSGVDFAAEDPWRVAVSLGSAVGGTTRLEHDYVLVSERGQRWDVDRSCTGRSRPARWPRTWRNGSAPRAPCRPCPPAAPPDSTPWATPSTPSRRAAPTSA
jgi:minimal PKS ketosynthase (KS/KS alpha)